MGIARDGPKEQKSSDPIIPPAENNRMDSSSSSSSSRAWTFSVRVPATASGEVVCLSGSADALGRWSPDDVLPMERMWEAEVVRKRPTKKALSKFQQYS